MTVNFTKLCTQIKIIRPLPQSPRTVDAHEEAASMGGTNEQKGTNQKTISCNNMYDETAT